MNAGQKLLATLFGTGSPPAQDVQTAKALSPRDAAFASGYRWLATFYVASLSDSRGDGNDQFRQLARRFPIRGASPCQIVSRSHNGWMELKPARVLTFSAFGTVISSVLSALPEQSYPGIAGRFLTRKTSRSVRFKASAIGPVRGSFLSWPGGTTSGGYWPPSPCARRR